MAALTAALAIIGGGFVFVAALVYVPQALGWLWLQSERVWPIK